MFMSLPIVGSIDFSYSQDFEAGHFKKNEIFSNTPARRPARRLAIEACGLILSLSSPNGRTEPTRSTGSVIRRKIDLLPPLSLNPTILRANWG
jgi:hypothetical protein